MSTIDAGRFGRDLSRAFAKQAAGLGMGEVPLFRALTGAVHHLSKSYHVEEFHGGRRQVTFASGHKIPGRTPRCELADLLVVAFRRKPRRSCRMSFLQMKSERHRTLASSSAACEYHANLEQWDLLCHRPLIRPLGRFRAPRDLLSGALLPSVGAFGFFVPTPAKRRVELRYCSADTLNKCAGCDGRYGKVFVRRGRILRTISGIQERTRAGSLSEFGQALALHQIGTPIERSSHTDNSQYRYSARKWLYESLAALLASAQSIQDGGGLAEDLRRFLAEDGLDGPKDGLVPRALVILRTD